MWAWWCQFDHVRFLHYALTLKADLWERATSSGCKSQVGRYKSSFVCNKLGMGLKDLLTKWGSNKLYYEHRKQNKARILNPVFKQGSESKQVSVNQPIWNLVPEDSSSITGGEGISLVRRHTKLPEAKGAVILFLCIWLRIQMALSKLMQITFIPMKITIGVHLALSKMLHLEIWPQVVVSWTVCLSKL